ncbi:MAG: ATP-dependent DNA helicase [Spirochaetales bacterium]|nr:ATP-dependent DNA helicase [Spirochaetales bacterium]
MYALQDRLFPCIVMSREAFIYKISVRELVAFTLNRGSLGHQVIGGRRAREGSREHHRWQKQRPPGYQAEVPVLWQYQEGTVALELNGRIDGVYTRERPVRIEELKTASRLPDDPDPQHWAQLQCYGYMYACNESLEQVEISLVYLELNDRETREFKRTCSRDELWEAMEKLLAPYVAWLAGIEERRERRNLSLEKLEFPYPHYREGQRNLAIGVYRSVARGELLFARAPTGTGKTMAVLFPALKALGRGLCERLFYLTARTTGRLSAETALEELRARGMYLIQVSLTAKEKLCFSPGAGCDPALCPYAENYFAKLPRALKALDTREVFDRAVIEELAREYRVCPFEYSLDLSLAADCLLCDYNYVFDPRVSLKRHFAQGKVEYYLLIDEAHNLVDRGRSMFSTTLEKKDVLDLKRLSKSEAPRLSRSLEGINKYFITRRKQIRTGNSKGQVSRDPPEELLVLLREWLPLAEALLDGGSPGSWRPVLLDFYFTVLNFLRMAELFGPHYVTWFESTGQGNVRATLLCLDPAPFIARVLKSCRGAVFFSATLLPLDYFKQSLVGDPEALSLNLPSPFSPARLGLFVASRISTLYRHREESCGSIAALVAGVFFAKPGPYLVYFPSYAYLQQVQALFCLHYPEIEILVQSRQMDETERSAFVNRFAANAGQPLVGFAVMGGIFAEGIDLVGDKLIGVIVVGVGLPQLCGERDLIRDYYTERGMDGFSYGYMIPGFNKVLQAAGRLIRSEQDRGVVVLVGARFLRRDYLALFPAEWRHYTAVEDVAVLPEFLDRFWAGN